MCKFVAIRCWLITVYCISLWSCGIRKNNEVEPETLVRIYDHESYTDSFEPVDLVQTADKGFLILTERRDFQSDFPAVGILKTDKHGLFVKETRLPDDFVNPVGKLMKTASGYYFFCMNRLTLQSILMRLSEDGTREVVAELPLTYPLASALDQDSEQLLLLSYDREEKEMVVCQVNSAGQIRTRTGFGIGFGDFDAEASIIRHFAGTGPRLPFLCGTSGDGTCFFNGYYRYALSLVFFAPGVAATPAVVYGYRDERAINSIIANGNHIALSKFEFGSTFFIPLWPGGSGVYSSSDIAGYPIPELKESTMVVTRELSINGKGYIVYGSSTRSGQIALYFYGDNDATLAGIRYLGYGNPYEIKSLTTTEEGGIAVCGQTWIAGRFSRICFFKLSANDLREIF